MEVPGIEVEVSREKLEEYIRTGRIGDLLEVLMEGERIARDVYKYLSERSSGEERETFERLSKIEEGHYRRLIELKRSLSK